MGNKLSKKLKKGMGEQAGEGQRKVKGDMNQICSLHSPQINYQTPRNS